MKRRSRQSTIALTTTTLNRAALVVIPKQPYVDWANSLDEFEPRLDIADPHYEYTVYLVDAIGYDSDVPRVLKRYYPIIFEHELAAWYLDTTAWPAKRDLRTFKKWFDVKACSIVLDLCKYPLEVEEFEV
jgi:hypothetical protein